MYVFCRPLKYLKSIDKSVDPDQTDQAYLDRNLEKPFLFYCQIASFLNIRLSLYFTSSRCEFYIFHLYLVAFIFIIS